MSYKLIILNVYTIKILKYSDQFSLYKIIEYTFNINIFNFYSKKVNICLFFNYITTILSIYWLFFKYLFITM